MLSNLFCCDFIECTKPGTNVTTILIENYTHFIDFNILVQHSMPSGFHSWVDGSDLPFLPQFSDSYFTDIIIKIEGELFRCHKVS
jgi:hypothetical protein